MTSQLPESNLSNCPSSNKVKVECYRSHDHLASWSQTAQPPGACPQTLWITTYRHFPCLIKTKEPNLSHYFSITEGEGEQTNCRFLLLHYSCIQNYFTISSDISNYVTYQFGFISISINFGFISISDLCQILSVLDFYQFWIYINFYQFWIYIEEDDPQ